MKKFQIKREISVGEILTILSILISVVALISSWKQDRDLTIRSRANNIRQEASNTLAKIERWKQINISFYDRLDPHYVEASELFYKNNNNIELRDFLWKKLNEAKYNSEEDLRSEKLESSYYGLLSYYSSIDTLYSVAILMMDYERTSQYQIFLRQMEAICFNASTENEQTADLGNKFRNLGNKYKSQLKDKFKEIDNELRNELRNLIISEDKNIVKSKSS